MSNQTPFGDAVENFADALTEMDFAVHPAVTEALEALRGVEAELAAEKERKETLVLEVIEAVDTGRKFKLVYEDGQPAPEVTPEEGTEEEPEPQPF